MLNRNDRRFESRLFINMGAILYLENGCADDISCIVLNVSENGACFEVKSEYDKYFNVGDEFNFCIYDNSMKKIGITNEIINGHAFIRYIKKGKRNNVINVGCYAQSDDLNKYIQHKIVCYIIESKD